MSTMDPVPHLSGLVSISGGGNVQKPIIILKTLQKVGNLTDMEPHCFSATSQNGWSMKDLWIHYALGFPVQMSKYRVSLPREIRENKILLVIDGHKSRLNILAAMIFF
jgi:hypothetical protein